MSATMIRALLIALLFSAQAQAVERFVIIGDSITAGDPVTENLCASWAYQVQKMVGWNVPVTVDAVQGRGAYSYTPSPDFHSRSQSINVIIWIGANDSAFFSTGETLEALQALVDFYRVRSVNRIILAAPQVFESQWGHDTQELHNRIDEVEGAIIVRPPTVSTHDGVHPDCSGQEHLAIWWTLTLISIMG